MCYLFILFDGARLYTGLKPNLVFPKGKESKKCYTLHEAPKCVFDTPKGQDALIEAQRATLRHQREMLRTLRDAGACLQTREISTSDSDA